ncbi:DUF3304 domain-containing protein [Paraburkholderia acidicola]|nr:DUF3304 domain-containing protein [Paraburkholderia acidicola]
MKTRNVSRFCAGVLLMLCMGLAACQQHDDTQDRVPVGLTGIDHLADHLSVQAFSVDGTDGFQAGQGGRTVCCVTLPRKWRPDMNVTVGWNVTNWRDCKGNDYEVVVPVEKYGDPEQLWVHFMADGKVRVVSSAYGAEKANAPGSKHPVKDPIPDKYPWDVYDLKTCKRYDQESPDRKQP